MRRSPALVLITLGGFEPHICTVKGCCPGRLDERARKEPYYLYWLAPHHSVVKPVSPLVIPALSRFLIVYPMR